jgi:cell division septation protein DedD
MRRFSLLSAVGLGLALSASAGQAQMAQTPPPNAAGQAPGGLNGLIESSREDVNAAYAITPEAGQWVICVASYQGESSAELANLLCGYLRQKHQAAYVYNRGNVERKKMQDELDQFNLKHPGMPRRRVLAHLQEDQFAVLIGGFRDMDAANAQLKKIHKWDLPNLQLKSGKPAFDTIDHYEPVPGKNTCELKRYPINPFHSAMVVPNPTAPPQRPVAAKFDPLWKKLNAHEPRSLYKCPKPWTLAVQDFRGAEVLQTSATSSNSFLEKLGFGDHFGKRLDNSVGMAQNVCDMFRHLGFKSYVLHTRNGSVVTVGEFNSPNDPEMARTQRDLARISFKKGVKAGNSYQQTGETAFNLFSRAMPMEVPR